MFPINITPSELLRKAEKIYKAGLAEVEPENLVKKNVSTRGEKLIIQDKIFDLASFNSIYLVSFGKASIFMAKTLMELLGDRIKEGIAVCLPQKEIRLKNIICLSASHPLPDKRSVTAAQDILSLARKAGEKDLLLVLVSGGGSAQICLPHTGISLDEKRFVTEKLLKAGASITELNTVRKHLSRIKGGHLAQEAYPATMINLIISDVRRNDLESIASGPTHWDSSTYEDAVQVLEKYKLWNSAPSSIQEVLKKGIQGKIVETLKKDNQVFRNVFSFIIGDNRAALRTAKKEAQRLGFKTFILTSSDQGEARDIARHYISLLLNILQSGKIISQPLCLLAGGELTVTVKGKGKGGRNQEFILAALIEMEGHFKEYEGWLILSLGSDGIDGPTDAAGAWANESSFEQARKLSLDPSEFLERNDSYNFFKKGGGLIITGPTHTNVMDLRLFLTTK